MKTYYHTLRWRRLSQQLKKSANYRCQECGKAGALETHHIQPVADGGSFFDKSNLIVLCRNCHIAKHKKPLNRQYQEWLNFRDELI